MKNLVLTGMMGCGKTTCGKLLAQRLGRELIDTDAYIEQRQGRTIAEIFAAEGEPYFRALELDVCRELSGQQNLVIACGGGLPLQAACRDALGSSGVVVFLNRDPGAIYDSLDTQGRPLAQQDRAAFLERFRQREPVYRAWADVTVTDPASPEAAVEELLNKVEAFL